jgi:hypothetical protein
LSGAPLNQKLTLAARGGARNSHETATFLYGLDSLPQLTVLGRRKCGSPCWTVTVLTTSPDRFIGLAIESPLLVGRR